MLNSGKMTESSSIVGDPHTHKRFLDGHIPVLIEFPAIQKLANQLWDAALERYNEPPKAELHGEELQPHLLTTRSGMIANTPSIT
jgi:hypothetical protein